MPHIDPRLSRHLEEADADTLIHAIIVISSNHQDQSNDLPEISQVDKLAEQVLRQTREQINEQPAFVRLIPRANAIVLTATSKLINFLLNHPCVQIASSATVDPFLF